MVEFLAKREACSHVMVTVGHSEGKPPALNAGSEGTLVPYIQRYFLTECDMRGNLRKLSLHQSSASEVDSSRDKSMYVVNSLSTSSVGVSALTDILLDIFSRMEASHFAFFGGCATSLSSCGAVEVSSTKGTSSFKSFCLFWRLCHFTLFLWGSRSVLYKRH